jgi:hypothetical protein
MHPQLAKLNEQFARAADLAKAACTGLTEEQLTLRADSAQWSIAECLVHLNLSSETFLSEINKACIEARQRQLHGDGPFRKDLRGSVLRWFMMPPVRIKVRTSSILEPSMIWPVEKALPRFLELQAGLQKLIEEADGLDLNRIMIASSISRLVRYNLFACFEIVIAHQLRHLWQIEHIKSQLRLNREHVVEKQTKVI